MVPGSAGVFRDIRANMERTSLPKGLDHYGPGDQRNSRQPCPEPGGATVTVRDPCWQWISSGMGTRPARAKRSLGRAGRSARAARLGRGRWPAQISWATENLPWPIWWVTCCLPVQYGRDWTVGVHVPGGTDPIPPRCSMSYGADIDLQQTDRPSAL